MPSFMLCLFEEWWELLLLALQLPARHHSVVWIRGWCVSGGAHDLWAEMPRLLREK